MAANSNMPIMNCLGRYTWLIAFAIAMAFVEAAVVVYLRHIFYPDGFVFPLDVLDLMGSGARLLGVEVARELVTMIMLAAVAALTGQSRSERWACFLLAFGLWDIFYYIFLKLIIGWPATFFDWDVLFLIPWPWVAPVLAPVAMSVVMIFCALLVLGRQLQGRNFRLGRVGLLLVLVGIAVVLFSFLRDRAAALGQQPPQAYWYPLLVIGIGLWVTAFVRAFYRASYTP